jgi:XTP/dITP diphosphohydrolase
MKELLLATNNLGKAREISQALSDLNLRILSLHDLGERIRVEEDGKTYLENARKKAREVGLMTNKLTLADDSGLEVEALGGLPGVESANFARKGASDRENNEKLLKLLEGVPFERRRARFRCVMVLFDPLEKVEEWVEGSVEGFILDHPRGEQGFGYDPLFFIPELGKTLAELPLEVKNSISHRGRALMAIKEVLKKRYKV